MSGPKVVRIVSREELVAQCEGTLAGLDAAREEWIRVGLRNELLSEPEISAARLRHAAIRELLRHSRFAEVQREASAEIASLQDDLERRLAAAATAAAAARSAHRRRSQVAGSVLSALEAAGNDVPAELLRALRSAAAGGADSGTAIANGFALLATMASPGLTKPQWELASALKEDADAGQRSAKWDDAVAKPPHEVLLSKVDGYIATLRGLTDAAACETFESRAAKLAGSADDVGLAPRLDSLVVDLARAVDSARARVASQARVSILAAELRQLATDQALAESESATQALDGSIEVLKQAEARAAAMLERVRDEAAAHSRRRAVLAGLSSLGYEVTEAMETAWVANGRVVLRQTARPGYGVEVGGGSDAGRVQLRTVAFREPTAAPDVSRDRDAETIWCGELGKLREQFAGVGGEIIVEQALGVGAVPLRSVNSASVQEEHAQRSQSRPRNEQRSI